MSDFTDGFQEGCAHIRQETMDKIKLLKERIAKATEFKSITESEDGVKEVNEKNSEFRDACEGMKVMVNAYIDEVFGVNNK